MTHWMDPDSSQWKCQEQWKVVNEKRLKSSQWKGLAYNENPEEQWKATNKISWAAMKSAQWRGQKQWKVANEKCWPAMKSSQWKGLACNKKHPMTIPAAMKSSQWKKGPAMKSYWKTQGLLWKNLHHKRAWDLYDILFIKVCGAMHIICIA